jgi:DNA-binding NtrC family response regulator
MASAEQALRGGRMPQALSLLIVDDDRNSREQCRSVAESSGFSVFMTDNVAGVLGHLEIRKTDLVLLEARVAGREGHSLLRSIKQAHPDTELIMTSSQATVESVLAAMKSGATDYLRKPFHAEELRIVLEKAATQLRSMAEDQTAREQLKSVPEYTAMVGQSEEMQKILRIITRVASSKHPVLIVGENGTGKHLLARAIHDGGIFRERPFVSVDCAASTPAALEAELFGYVKGAFNASSKAKDGLIQLANGGTLFLHDVSELTLELQSKLLHTLQDREIKPLGSNKPIALDIRVIASTSRDMEAAIQQGTFRRDLFFRLNVVNFRLPPLRERREDIPLLVDVILKRVCGDKGLTYSLSPEAMKTLMTYEWPQNVRELEHCLERAAATASSPILTVDDFPLQVRTAHLWVRTTNKVMGNGIVPLAEIEKQAIISTLEQLNGDKQMAARLLGIGKTTLYRKLREYGKTENWASSPVMRSKSA